MDEIIKNRIVELGTIFHQISYEVLQSSPRLNKLHKEIRDMGFDVELSIYVGLRTEPMDLPKVDKSGRVRFSKKDKERLKLIARSGLFDD